MSTISQLDHIAIAVRNMEEALAFYQGALGLSVERMEEMPERGIKVAFLALGETRIELIEPLHDHSEVSKFLAERGPGIHHLALRVKNVDQLSTHLTEQNVRMVYPASRAGAHQTKVNFVHPKSSLGALLELVETDH